MLGLICFGCNGTALSAELPAGAPASAVTPGTCRLAVLLVFDQMRADYLERWGALLSETGIRRLQEEGACFTTCNYPFACTETGPGHATLRRSRLAVDFRRKRLIFEMFELPLRF
jgi:hypothetical protein